MNDQFARDASKIAYGTSQEALELAQKYNVTLVYDTGEARAYYDNTNQIIMIANRGTDVSKGGKDIWADISIGLGLEDYSPRFDRAMNVQREIEQQYPNADIIQTGHSLGGSLAEYVGNKSERVTKIVTFNQGSGIGDIGKTVSNKQVDYIDIWDPVSALHAFQEGGKTKYTTKYEPWKDPIGFHDIYQHTVSKTNNSQTVSQSQPRYKQKLINKGIKRILKK